MKYNLALACAALLSLPACFPPDRPDTSGNPTAGVNGAVSLESLGKRALDFSELDLAPTNGDLPTVDGVAYSGVAVYGEREFPIVGVQAPGEDSAAIALEGPSSNTTFLAVGAAMITANFMSRNVDVTADNFFQVDDPGSVDLEGFSNLQQASGTAIVGSMSGTLQEGKSASSRILEIGIPAPYSGNIAGSLTRDGDIESSHVSMDVAGGFLGANSEAFIATTPGFADNPFVPSDFFDEFATVREPVTGTRQQRVPIQIHSLTETFGGVIGVVTPD